MTAGPYSIGSDRWAGLSKLTEEAGEVLQIVGKLMGTGGEVGHWDGGRPLDARLVDEMADLAAAVEFVVEVNGLDRQYLAGRRAHKLNQFRQWHEEQKR